MSSFDDFEPDDREYTPEQKRAIQDAYERGLVASTGWVSARLSLHDGYNCPCYFSPIIRIQYHDPYPEPSE